MPAKLARQVGVHSALLHGEDAAQHLAMQKRQERRVLLLTERNALKVLTRQTMERLHVGAHGRVEEDWAGGRQHWLGVLGDKDFEGVVPEWVVPWRAHETVLHQFVVQVWRLDETYAVLRQVAPKVAERFVVQVGVQAAVVVHDEVARRVGALDVKLVPVVVAQEPAVVLLDELALGFVCPEDVLELGLGEQRLPAALPLAVLWVLDVSVFPLLVDDLWELGLPLGGHVLAVAVERGNVVEVAPGYDAGVFGVDGAEGEGEHEVEHGERGQHRSRAAHARARAAAPVGLALGRGRVLRAGHEIGRYQAAVVAWLVAAAAVPPHHAGALAGHHCREPRGRG
mmetsp:Transcript_23751/g.75718  ORF Transcript_23751/g.75718 Transcript_23751/m.75718 type:complete len:340 (-) Transcript_23751:96-1115(-)